MRANKKLLIVIICLFSCAFLIVGYASISRDLYISGTASIKPPVKKIYISNAKLLTTSGATSVSFDYMYPTNFSSVVNAQQIGGTVTYEIEVHNNTDITYWYHGVKLVESFESNSLIGTDNGISITTKDRVTDVGLTFNTDDWVPPHTHRTFYVTYKYGSNAKGYLTTFVNFHFDIRIDGVYDRFLQILNDKTSTYGYNYLAQVFNEKYAEDGTTVIGNIGEDKQIFDNMFGEDLVVEIDGVKVPVTVMVRRENVDGLTTGDSYPNGANGCEYTLYITAGSLSPAGATETVYAISYTIDSNGQAWYQLAELYEGTAKAEDYDQTDGIYEGAVDIETWIASKKDYQTADGLVYKVGYEQGDQYDKLKTLEDLMSTFDQDIFNDIDNTKIMKKVYDIYKANEYSTADEIAIILKAYTKAAPYFNNFNNGQEFKVIRSYTRAQIIPVIEELQEALDYYHQVRG